LWRPCLARHVADHSSVFFALEARARARSELEGELESKALLVGDVVWPEFAEERKRKELTAHPDPPY
jgi:hypothetical protein